MANIILIVEPHAFSGRIPVTKIGDMNVVQITLTSGAPGTYPSVPYTIPIPYNHIEWYVDIPPAYPVLPTYFKFYNVNHANIISISPSDIETKYFNASVFRQEINDICKETVLVYTETTAMSYKLYFESESDYYQFEIHNRHKPLLEEMEWPLLDQKLPQVIAWLHSNNIITYQYTRRASTQVIRFKDHTDAVMCKMRWIGDVNTVAEDDDDVPF